jgi:hypothetical protein
MSTMSYVIVSKARKRNERGVDTYIETNGMTGLQMSFTIYTHRIRAKHKNSKEVEDGYHDVRDRVGEVRERRRQVCTGGQRVSVMTLYRSIPNTNSTYAKAIVKSNTKNRVRTIRG